MKSAVLVSENTSMSEIGFIKQFSAVSTKQSFEWITQRGSLPGRRERAQCVVVHDSLGFPEARKLVVIPTRRCGKHVLAVSSEFIRSHPSGAYDRVLSPLREGVNHYGDIFCPLTDPPPWASDPQHRPRNRGTILTWKVASPCAPQHLISLP